MNGATDEPMERGTVAGAGTDKVRPDRSARAEGAVVNRRRLAIVAIAVVVAVVGLVRCGGDIVGLGRTGTANSDQAFRNGSFLTRVTSLAYGVQEIGVDAAARARGVSAYKPRNGQFIVFYAEATNVGLTATSMPSTASSLSDPRPDTANPPTRVRFG